MEIPIISHIYSAYKEKQALCLQISEGFQQSANEMVKSGKADQSPKMWEWRIENSLRYHYLANSATAFLLKKSELESTIVNVLTGI